MKDLRALKTILLVGLLTTVLTLIAPVFVPAVAQFQSLMVAGSAMVFLTTGAAQAEKARKSLTSTGDQRSDPDRPGDNASSAS